VNGRRLPKTGYSMPRREIEYRNGKYISDVEVWQRLNGEFENLSE
jgi:hypothetical protein